MSRKILIDAFYNNFNDFVDQLIRVFPTDADFPTYRAGMSLFQMTNPLLPITEFRRCTQPFAQQIAAKDDAFFLNYAYDEFTATDNTLEPVIGKLKGMWSVLSESNRGHVWDYLILLSKIADRVLVAA
jgi:hypothetical protein